MSLQDRMQERTIDGVLYRVTPLPFGIGQQALMKLIKALAPLFSAASAKDNTAFIAAIPSALSADDLAWFCRVLGDGGGAKDYLCQVKDGEAWATLVDKRQDTHFAGRYDIFGKWLLFCLEVNFRSFFDGIKNGSNAMGALAQAMTPSA